MSYLSFASSQAHKLAANQLSLSDTPDRNKLTRDMPCYANSQAVGRTVGMGSCNYLFMSDQFLIYTRSTFHSVLLRNPVFGGCSSGCIRMLISAS